ncbi:hypothetical protein VNO77_35309 [Canavalia gladiata]|uniref:Uncharacterized protein n=1 Tax=Canavalia gladiata TaxID=3824 RepID=A0AAN9KIG4_CANGL
MIETRGSSNCVRRSQTGNDSCLPLCPGCMVLIFEQALLRGVFRQHHTWGNFSRSSRYAARQDEANILGVDTESGWNYLTRGIPALESQGSGLEHYKKNLTRTGASESPVNYDFWESTANKWLPFRQASQPEVMAANANWLQHGASPVLQGPSNGLVLSPEQIRLMGLVPSQRDQSLYGLPISGSRATPSLYSHEIKLTQIMELQFQGGIFKEKGMFCPLAQELARTSETSQDKVVVQAQTYKSLESRGIRFPRCDTESLALVFTPSASVPEVDVTLAKEKNSLAPLP